MPIAVRLLAGFLCSSLAWALPAGPIIPQSAAGLGLNGQAVDPLQNAQTTVLVFVRTDCPISNRYAPEVRRLQEKFGGIGFTFWLVYSDPDETADEIRRHIQEYAYPCRVLRDPQHVLLRLSHASVTPEAAVFTAGRRLIYHGRIDDLYADLSHKRPVARTHDLEAVLRSVARGDKVEATYAPAIGCTVPPLP